MNMCETCEQQSRFIAARPGVCGSCLRDERGDAGRAAQDAHRRVRRRFGLPPEPPATPGGAQCAVCVNACRLGPGETGYCGARRNDEGAVRGGEPAGANVSWYHDPLPTNCVADWVCAGGTGAGHPRYAHSDGPEHGHVNLAVFYQACTFDCLSCQNWHFRRLPVSSRSAAELAAAVGPTTSCICHFGGDPTPQIAHALAASRLALEQAGDRILRICWETNGAMSPGLLDEMVALSLQSGGCVKFDLKAHSESLHRALCGVTNKRTLENFERAARRVRERPEPPLLIAATLMVPGYVDAEQVGRLARFVAGINPDIPYALLAFAPQFEMSDLPCTPRSQAMDCLAAARDAGLTRVRLGNEHLLGPGPYR